MSQIKLAALLMMPLILASSYSSAQEKMEDCVVKTQTTSPLFIIPPNDVYGPFIPYVPPKACAAPSAQMASSSSSQPNSSSVKESFSDSLTKSTTSSHFGGTSLSGSDLILPPDVTPSIRATPSAAPIVEPTPPASAAPLASAAPIADPTAEPVSTYRYVRNARIPLAVTEPPDLKPFRTFAFGFKADTLGAGFEIATPLLPKINLRSSFNIFAFNDGFSIDGIDYNARLHLKSSETTIDWFPVGGAFHISTGVLWLKNTMTAPVSVGPGQTFTLGGQSFLNSVDDPVNGSSSVSYSHSFAPLLLVGLGNIIPRTNRRISFPIEIGAAYTHAPEINLNLSGTICTTEGCVNLVQNTEAVESLKQEINRLNKDLTSYPIFPIVSVGVAYHF